MVYMEFVRKDGIKEYFVGREKEDVLADTHDGQWFAFPGMTYVRHREISTEEMHDLSPKALGDGEAAVLKGMSVSFWLGRG